MASLGEIICSVVFVLGIAASFVLLYVYMGNNSSPPPPPPNPSSNSENP